MAPSCRQRVEWTIFSSFVASTSAPPATTATSSRRVVRTTHSSRKKVFKIFSWSVNEHLPYVLSLNNYNSLLAEELLFFNQLHFYFAGRIIFNQFKWKSNCFCSSIIMPSFGFVVRTCPQTTKEQLSSQGYIIWHFNLRAHNSFSDGKFLLANKLDRHGITSIIIW